MRAQSKRTPEFLVVRVQARDHKALESLIGAVQKEVYALAVRFLWHLQDAEDAAQEILLRVIANLAGFRAESGFRTWVYRIAPNTLLTLRKQRMEERSMSFEEFGEDLVHGLSDEAPRAGLDIRQSLLLEEVKIGCTSAMLMCLDRDHRMAYILDKIVELDHKEAGEVLKISPAAFRKRLSRARQRITAFMTSRYGLVNPTNPCRCRRRLATAVARKRVDPANLLFASSLNRSRQFPQLLARIRQLEDTRRAAALYRSHPDPKPSPAFLDWLRKVLEEEASRGIDQFAPER